MKITEALQHAIKAERQGHDFYMMAAHTTEDAKGKKIFETLAKEELDHMHFLHGQFEAISRSGKPDPQLKLGTKIDLQGAFPIFSEGIKARIHGAHYEMTALSIGIQLELDAMNFYKGEADTNPDPVIKGFFLELAEWERGHYQALLNQETSLKEDYWSDAGFAPF